MVHQIKHKEIVGHDKCSSCGAKVEVKVNAAGGLYAYCTAIVRPELSGNKKYCWDRHTFSPHAVGEILNDYLEGKALENVQTEFNEEQADIERSDTEIIAGIDNRGDDGATIVPTVTPEHSSRSIGGSIAHFFTAD